jgi:hypothetical protein
MLYMKHTMKRHCLIFAFVLFVAGHASTLVAQTDEVKLDTTQSKICCENIGGREERGCEETGENSPIPSCLQDLQDKNRIYMIILKIM